MRKITILSVGKNKERWLEEAVQEYIKRLSSWAQVMCEWVKDDHDLLKRTTDFSYSQGWNVGSILSLSKVDSHRREAPLQLLYQ